MKKNAKKAIDIYNINQLQDTINHFLKSQFKCYMLYYLIAINSSINEFIF